jgi:hypothetical protein
MTGTVPKFLRMLRISTEAITLSFVKLDLCFS